MNWPSSSYEAGDDIVYSIPTSGIDIDDILSVPAQIISNTPKHYLISAIAALALGATITLTMNVASNITSSGQTMSQRELRTSRYARQDSRNYLDISFKGKHITISDFPNHFRNPETDLEQIITSNSDDPALIYGLLEHESVDWNPDALSPKFAGGLGQFMVETANQYAEKLHFDKIIYPMKVKGKTYTESNPCMDENGKYDWRFNPVKVAEAAIEYLKDKKAEFGDLRFVVASYNHGEKGVKDDIAKAHSADFEKVSSYMPEETQKYVPIIMGKRNLYKMILPFESGVKFNVSSFYGSRDINKDGVEEFHTGIDLAAPEGTKLIAVTDGTVLNCGNIDNGYGNQVWIADDFGKIHMYGHLSKVGVKKGQRLKQGQYVGKVGNTGHSFGNHLHYNLYNLPVYTPLKDVTNLSDIKGYSMDPMRYFTKSIILLDEKNEPMIASR